MEYIVEITATINLDSPAQLHAWIESELNRICKVSSVAIVPYPFTIGDRVEYQTLGRWIRATITAYPRAVGCPYQLHDEEGDRAYAHLKDLRRAGEGL